MKNFLEYIKKLRLANKNNAQESDNTENGEEKLVKNLPYLIFISLIGIFLLAFPIGRTILKYISYYLIGITIFMSLAGTICGFHFLFKNYRIYKLTKYIIKGPEEKELEDTDDTANSQDEVGYLSENEIYDFDLYKAESKLPPRSIVRKNEAYFFDCSALMAYADKLYACMLAGELIPSHIGLNNFDFYTSRDELSELWTLEQLQDYTQRRPGSPYFGYTAFVCTNFKFLPELKGNELILSTDETKILPETPSEKLIAAILKLKQDGTFITIISQNNSLSALASCNQIPVKLPQQDLTEFDELLTDSDEMPHDVENAEAVEDVKDENTQNDELD